MSNHVIPPETKLAAKRAFWRTTSQGYATSISASLIISIVSLITSSEDWLIVLVAVITAIVTPPAAGLAAYFQWLGKGIPEEYVPAAIEKRLEEGTPGV